MKQIYFDTSAVVASSSKNHAHYAATIPWLQALRHGRIKGVISCHVIAEYYSTMTNAKTDFAVEPDILAETLSSNLSSTFKILPLPQSQYFSAIDRCAEQFARNGKVYDFIHLEAALAANCDGLLTLNFREFTRIAQGEKIRIIDAATEKPL